MTTDDESLRALNALAACVEARREYMHETTQKAVDATAVTLLKSLRADTSVVGKKPTIFDGRYYVEIEETGYIGGWAAPAGKYSAKGHRAIRPEGGGKSLTHINGYKVINLAGDYKRCKRSRVYKLSIYNRGADAARPWYPAKADCVYVMATDRADVEKFAEERIARRIGQYRGVSKRALGAAMHLIAAGKASGGSDLERLANSIVDVRRAGEGFSSGEYSVAFVDNLEHSAQALKSGSVSLSIQKASNATAGRINNYAERAGMFWENVAAPFPEITRGGTSRAHGRRLSARDTLVKLEV